MFSLLPLSKSNFFTRVAIGSFVSHSCSTHVARIALVSCQISDICKVWKHWSLKDGSVPVCKNFKEPSFCVAWTKKLQTFIRHFFESGFQKIVLSNLLLFLYTCYYVDLCDIQWNEAETLTAPSFNNNWPL